MSAHFFNALGTNLAFAGIPEPALAGEFTCRKAGKRPYGRAAKPPPTARDIPQDIFASSHDKIKLLP
jgi:hypothetical protein